MINVYESMEKGKPFSDFAFHEQLQSTLDEIGFTHCTPVQDRAMPHIMSGQDVAGLAQTGTGKTGAFLIPLVERILRSKEESVEDDKKNRVFEDWQKRHFILCLVPTRELAEQVKDNARQFLKNTDERVVVVYGGVSIDRQVEQLGKGFSFLIATPGRLIDLYKEHKVDLKQVRGVVFDEADRMFDMGFKDDMKYILRRVPENRQLMLFSATLNLDVFNVAYQFGANPVELNVSQDQTTAENIDHKIFHLGRDEKPPHLLALFKKYEPKQVIIFTNFKSNVDRIAEFLTKNGHNALGISSLLNQGQRKKIMGRFRASNGDNILVATDVAARGLDIEGVDLVINYELPEDAENYVHRIGRTGRAGDSGHAFSFVSDKDVEALERIEKYLDEKIDVEWMESEDLPTEFEGFPRGELLINKNRTKKPQGKGRPRRKGGDRKRDGRDRKDNRDRKESREGREERKSRSGQKRSRHRDRNRDRDRKRDEEGQQTSADSNKSVHRDKASGRHRGAQSVSSQGKKKSRRRRNNNNNQQRRGQSRRMKPSRQRVQEKPQTMVGKVKSLMKRIFGD